MHLVPSLLAELSTLPTPLSMEVLDLQASQISSWVEELHLNDGAISSNDKDAKLSTASSGSTDCIRNFACICILMVVVLPRLSAVLICCGLRPRRHGSYRLRRCRRCAQRRHRRHVDVVGW